MQWLIQRGAPRARAPPYGEDGKYHNLTRGTNPPPHGLGKSQIWRPPFWDFLDEPLVICDPLHEQAHKMSTSNYAKHHLFPSSTVSAMFPCKFSRPCSMSNGFPSCLAIQSHNSLTSTIICNNSKHYSRSISNVGDLS